MITWPATCRPLEVTAVAGRACTRYRPPPLVAPTVVIASLDSQLAPGLTFGGGLSVSDVPRMFRLPPVASFTTQVGRLAPWGSQPTAASFVVRSWPVIRYWRTTATDSCVMLTTWLSAWPSR